MTDAVLTFDPVLPVWLIVIIAILMTVVIGWMELAKQYRWRSVRFLCCTLLIISLIGILLRPQIRRSLSSNAILLTEQYQTADVDSLLEHHPASIIYKSPNAAQFENSKLVSSINSLPSDEIKVVVGNGLDRSALDVLQGQSFEFIPNKLPKGIVHLNLPLNSQPQTTNAVTGIFNNEQDSAKLILQGPGGNQDSIVVRQKGTAPFTLSFTPKDTGTFNYSIIVDGEKHILPVNVEAKKKLSVLILQTFPTFETGYLKNVLGADHNLVLRYQLSKNNFRYEYINHPQINTSRITIDMLNRFDLVIVDSDALNSLSGAELKNLQQAIHDGLGTLILFNEIPNANSSIKKISSLRFNRNQSDTARVFINKPITIATWPINVLRGENVLSSVRSSSRILAGYEYYGFGKIGFQLFQQTYKLLLEGDSIAYKKLWQTIVSKNARTEVLPHTIRLNTAFPRYVSEPIEIEIATKQANPPVLFHDGIQVPVSEHALIDELWTAHIRPKTTGWHQLQIQGDSSKHRYYVSNHDEWKSLAISNSIRETKRASGAASFDKPTSYYEQPAGQLWFFLLFLLAAAALWLIPKL